jgi:predicted small lipoprotein YifL
MKKFAAIFLALILVLSLGACGTTPETSEPSESGVPESSVAEQPDPASCRKDRQSLSRLRR